MSRTRASSSDDARAWKVALGCAIGLTVAFGPAVMASFGLYVKPISAEFGWTRTQVAAIFSIVALIGAAGTPILGFVLDKYGSRPILLLATVALPACLAVLPFLPDSYPIFITWGVALGAVAIITSPTAYIALLPQWFDRRIGMAIAFAMVGSGLGQAVFLMLHGALLDQTAWRSAWLIMSAGVAIVGIVNAWALLRDNQAVRALRRSGREAELPGTTTREALGTMVFWCAVLSFFIVMLVIGGMLAHLVPLLTDRGVGVAESATIAATIGITSLLGRLATGLVIDRVGYGVLGAIIFPAQALGCGLLMAGVDHIWLYAAAAAIGIAYGVEADMLPFMLRRTFGMRSFGKLYGIAFGVVQVGPVIGPLILGWSYDSQGSYEPGLGILVALSLISSALIFAASRLASPKRSSGLNLPSV